MIVVFKLRMVAIDKNLYSYALQPLVSMSILFGPGERLNSPVHSWLGGLIFSFLLCAMTFFAIMGVFVRRTIDTWIQFSLYIVPIIALISGFGVYTSSAFSKLLKRRLIKRWIGGKDADEDQDLPWHELQRATWLRKVAFKNCLYPLVLEMYQWVAYVIFHTVFKSDTFAGAWNKDQVVDLGIHDSTWLVLYCFFWVLAMYITGFVSYSFILISRLTVRDVISFMCRFGDSPFLLYRPTARGDVVLKTLHPIKTFFAWVFGFLFMDLLQSGKDIVLIYEQDKETIHQLHRESRSAPTDLQWDHFQSQEFDSPSSGSAYSKNSEVEELGVPARAIVTPIDACKYLSNIIRTIEVLGGLFQPFIVLILFFSVANVVIHVGAVVSLVKGFESSHWWTFVRTCIWLLLSLRLLCAVASITKAFAQVSQHVNYLWSIGQLQGDSGEWERFFKLVTTFQLGTKTYGFPLSLKKAAAIATFLNFSLIIGLSVMKPSVHVSSP